MAITGFLAHWGLTAVFVGAMMEGESFVIGGGALAQQGLLVPCQAALAAFVGSVAMDQLCFWCGRRFREHRWIQAIRRQRACGRAIAFVERHPTGYIIAFRYLYGLRIVSPIAIGLTSVAAGRFLVLNTAEALKQRDESVTIALTDPHGAALYSYYAEGELKAEGSSVAEGIGQGRITANLDGAPIDAQFRISDEEGLHWVHRLLGEQGLHVGLSSGINVAGAVALAKSMGPGHTIATILCDSGMRYLSTLSNPDWLKAKGLAIPPWLERR